MTDRELLELAAKAAGLNVHWGSAWQADIMFREIPRPSIPLVANVEWNPLADDGDALRLSVELRIDIRINDYDTLCYGPIITTHGSAAETHGTDPCAATRRAIVRAAAEIGRRK